MKTKNRIKSIVFLAAILFSFSVNAYNSLNKLQLNDITSFKSTKVNPSSENNCTSDNIFFEEQESEDNDKTFFAQAFFILPYFFSDFTSSVCESESFLSAIVPGTSQPLFISIRVLRI
ncbi:MAG: hypothetical protein JWO32_2141 [Bacteroidetes bacterium]|nr:hypothetical protein [Bacteroidota bacterium]